MTHDTRDPLTFAAQDMVPISEPGVDKSQTVLSPSSAPPNPFSRTLASIEPQEGVVKEDRISTEPANPVNSRMSMDVEGFKNLLMTGKSSPRVSAPVPQPAATSNPLGGPQFESSSSTDTSSISRQSLFEPSNEVITESSRTSNETVESDEDDKTASTLEGTPKKKKPPPAPKPRYGKPVAPRQPQIVSFDSFTATEPKPSPVTRSRDNSEASRPLPPTPVILSPPPEASTPEITEEPAELVRQRPSEPSTPSEVPTLQKKTPPPVPLARRQSQLRSSAASPRSRSNSSLTVSSQHSIEPLASPVSSIHDPMGGIKSPPPPPPPRYGTRLSDMKTSSANSSNTDLGQPSTPSRTATVSQSQSPSRRSTIEADLDSSSLSLGIKRTSSISSDRNRQRAVSNESMGSMGPPPPPPPRRKANRLSMEHSRPSIGTISPAESVTSTDNRRSSLDGKRRTSAASESSLRYEYTPVNEKGGNESALYSPREESENAMESQPRLGEIENDSSNILDDMEKFQREIDALRSNIKRVE